MPNIATTFTLLKSYEKYFHNTETTYVLDYFVLYWNLKTYKLDNVSDVASRTFLSAWGRINFFFGGWLYISATTTPPEVVAGA